MLRLISGVVVIIIILTLRIRVTKVISTTKD